MAAQNMPAAEVAVTVELARGLLRDQHPDLADLPLTELANGWDNVIYRLGTEYTVRVPRRQAAAVLVVSEQRWLPKLADRLPIPIPAPVRVGVPGRGYGWRWSICPWFEGDVAADVELADPIPEAERLGEFLRALHVPAPADAPENPYRGHRLDRLDQRVQQNLSRLALPRADDVVERWRTLRSADDWDAPPVWLHGDLHTANVLVCSGEISAVIDFGDITSGDPAVDLAVAWMLFGADDREIFRRAAGATDEALWTRAEAWALHFALVYLANSADNPRLARMGGELLGTILSE